MPKRTALLLLPTMVAAMMMVQTSPASADNADLQQAISDLDSQASDKERIDQRGAVRIELNEVRTWLRDAANKLKEEKEEWCRLVLERVRAQLRMVEQLIALSSLTAETQKAEGALGKARKDAAKKRQALADKSAHVQALRRMK